MLLRPIKLGMMFGLLMLPSLMGCALLTPSPAPSVPAPPVNANLDGFCLLARPIIYDRLHDTEATIEEIQEHNMVGQRICGWVGHPVTPATK
jgi:hypothetical protein